MLTVGILNDTQWPYCDKSAWSVALQVFKDAKLDLLFFNGDFGDYRTISTRYPQRYGETMIAEMSEELERQRTALKEAMETIKPKKARWNDGNHEFRIPRSFWNSPHGSQLLGIKEIQHATSIPQLLGLPKWKIRYSGEYPAGTWILGDTEPSGANDCYVTHGMISSKKAGQTANRSLDDMMANVVVGHCVLEFSHERAALRMRVAILGSVGGIGAIVACRRRPPLLGAVVSSLSLPTLLAFAFSHRRLTTMLPQTLAPTVGQPSTSETLDTRDIV